MKKQLLVILLFSASLNAFNAHGPLRGDYCDLLEDLPLGVLQAHEAALKNVRLLLIAKFFEAPSDSWGTLLERIKYFPPAVIHWPFTQGSSYHSDQIGQIKEEDPSRFLPSLMKDMVDPLMNEPVNDINNYDAWLAIYYSQTNNCLRCLHAEIKKRQAA